jgi:NAD(P)-dependent dehydrogenase (short-subunit alcohol dehydrogenase family)
MDKEEIKITMSLNEKSVLIVGGSSGIGLGVAEALLQEGAAVTIVGRTQEKLQRTDHWHRPQDRRGPCPGLNRTHPFRSIRKVKRK